MGSPGFSLTVDIPLFILGLWILLVLIDYGYSFVHIGPMGSPGFSLNMDIPLFTWGYGYSWLLIDYGYSFVHMGLWILLASH
jgi:hypothetical protein